MKPRPHKKVNGRNAITREGREEGIEIYCEQYETNSTKRNGICHHGLGGYQCKSGKKTMMPRLPSQKPVWLKMQAKEKKTSTEVVDEWNAKRDETAPAQTKSLQNHSQKPQNGNGKEERGPVHQVIR